MINSDPSPSNILTNHPTLDRSRESSAEDNNTDINTNAVVNSNVELPSSRTPPESLVPSGFQRFMNFLNNLGCPRMDFSRVDFTNINHICSLIVNIFLNCLFRYNIFIFLRIVWNYFSDKLHLLRNFLYRLQMLGFTKQYFQREQIKATDHSTIQYYSLDDTRNMALKITLEKINSFTGDVVIDIGEGSENKIDKYVTVIGYDRKLFSPLELLKYRSMTLFNSDIDKKYASDVSRISNEFPEEYNQNKMTEFGKSGFVDLLKHNIFSYTCEDKFQSDDILENIVCSSKEYPEKFKCENNECMYIMASFGEFKYDENKQLEWEGEEMVLCKIRVYDDGSFEMKPGFSVLPDINDGDKNIYRIKNRTKKVVKEKKYFLVTKDHETYKYTIELFNEGERDLEIDGMRKKMLKRMYQKSLSKMKKKTVGIKFEMPPQKEVERRFHVFGEVKSANNFDTNNSLFIKFSVAFDTKNYYFVENEKNLLASSTHSSKGLNQVCYFGFPFEYHFYSKNIIQKQEPPKVYFQVFEVDKWKRNRIAGYGYINIPFESGIHDYKVSTWKPISSIRNNLSSFFYQVVWK